MIIYIVYYSKLCPIYNGDSGVDAVFLDKTKAEMYRDYQLDYGDYQDYYVEEMEVD